MSNKEELAKFLDQMIDDNSEQAQVHFHSYLEDKMKGIINPAAAEPDLEDEQDDE
jgi:hypothetical protein